MERVLSLDLHQCETPGEFMRYHREKAGLSLPKLSELSGVHDNTIARWERGENCATVQLAEMVSDALGITIDEYCGHAELLRRNAKR